MPDCTIVVIDDDDAHQHLIARALERVGYPTPTPVVDALTAVDACAQPPADLAIVDLHMPGMDGISVIKGLRDLPHSMRIVAMSADATGIGESDSIKAGADAFVAKPFDLDELAEIVTSLLDG